MRQEGIPIHLSICLPLSATTGSTTTPGRPATSPNSTSPRTSIDQWCSAPFSTPFNVSRHVTVRYFPCPSFPSGEKLLGNTAAIHARALRIVSTTWSWSPTQSNPPRDLTHCGYESLSRMRIRLLLGAIACEEALRTGADDSENTKMASSIEE